MPIVQDPESAHYRSMPESAISTGLVDYILPVEQMPDQLIKYLKHPYLKNKSKKILLVPEKVNHLDRIYFLLRNQTGHNFFLLEEKFDLSQD